MAEPKNRTDWAALVRQVRDGRLVPVIGDSIGWAMMSDAQDLEELYSDYVNYPGHQRDGKAEIARFVTTEYDDYGAKNDYLAFVKQLALETALEKGHIDENVYDSLERKAEEISFSTLADAMRQPWLDDSPYPLLAQLPLPIYMTTSYHDFMQAALIEAGKEPRTKILAWNDALEQAADADPDYRPSVEQPLVYHLFGRDSDPLSLVLSEEDHLQFLINRPSFQPPPIIYRALNDNAMLLLGFRFRDWEFRTLFWGLLWGLDHRAGPNLAVDLAPLNGDSSSGPVRDYLQAFLAQEQIDVYWGTVQQFLEELFQRIV